MPPEGSLLSIGSHFLLPLIEQAHKNKFYKFETFLEGFSELFQNFIPCTSDPNSGTQDFLWVSVSLFAFELTQNDLPKAGQVYTEELLIVSFCKC